MAKGAYFEELGIYLVVEESEGPVKMITRVTFSKDRPEEVSPLARDLIGHVLGTCGPLKADLDMLSLTEFQRSVYKAVMAIPRGSTMTYAEIASKIRRPGAARAVGNAMASNPFVLVMPCHRVVSGKGLGGYGQGLAVKRRLLNLESIPSSIDRNQRASLGQSSGTKTF
jgi:methylated-DNA-[protein]-cysteine S-methyltransferase